MQSPLASLVKATGTVMAGLALAFLMQLVLFNALGFMATIGQNHVITATFFAPSIARRYVLRRLFNGLGRDGSWLRGSTSGRLTR